MLDLHNELVFGCWATCAQNLFRWKKRGCNFAALGHQAVPDNLSFEQYAATAAEQDMGISKVPHPTDPALDLQLPNFAAWGLGDEPEGWNHLPKDANGKMDAAASVRASRELAARLRTISPTTPIYRNFMAFSLAAMGGWERDVAAGHPIVIDDYKGWMADLNWASADGYPLAQRANPWMIAVQGEAINRLIGWGPHGVRAFGYVECGYWNENQKAGRIIRPDELRAEFWTQILCGATGMMFFQQPWTPPHPEPDPMPPELDVEIAANIALAKGWTPFLLQGTRRVIQVPPPNRNGYYEVAYTLQNKTLTLRLNTDPATELRGLKPYQLDRTLDWDTETEPPVAEPPIVIVPPPVVTQPPVVPPVTPPPAAEPDALVAKVAELEKKVAELEAAKVEADNYHKEIRVQRRSFAALLKKLNIKNI